MATKKRSRDPVVTSRIDNPADEQETTATPVLIQKDDIKLDLAISMGDLSEMVATDARAALIGIRNEITVRLNRTKAEHGELEKQLQEQSLVVVRGVENDQIGKDLANALAIFHGIPFGLVSDDVTIHTQDQTIGVSVIVATQKSIDAHIKAEEEKLRRIGSSGGYYGYGASYEHSNEKVVTKPFTAEMAEIVLKMRAVTQRAADIQTELDKTGHLLADMPNLAARAKSALTKAYLSGELRTGDDMLRVLAKVENIALPAAMRTDQKRLTSQNG